MHFIIEKVVDRESCSMMPSRRLCGHWGLNSEPIGLESNTLTTTLTCPCIKGSSEVYEIKGRAGLCQWQWLSAIGPVLGWFIKHVYIVYVLPKHNINYPASYKKLTVPGTTRIRTWQEKPKQRHGQYNFGQRTWQSNTRNMSTDTDILPSETPHSLTPLAKTAMCLKRISLKWPARTFANTHKS